MSDKVMSTELYWRFHSDKFFRLFNFMEITSWMRTLCNPTLLYEPWPFFKYTKLSTLSFYPNFSSSTWRVQYVWSVVDMLRRNPHGWSPIIFYTYGGNLDSRMLDKILYVVGKLICFYSYYSLFYFPLIYSIMIDSFLSSGNSKYK
jgi:hypothetical protein